MTTSSWFTTHKIAPNTWAIDDNGIDVIYLIAGTEHALLIDTGMGIGDLAAEVQKLTSLPLIVANTHGHIDHVSGNGQFPQGKHRRCRPGCSDRPVDRSGPRSYPPAFLQRREPPHPSPRF